MLDVPYLKQSNEYACGAAAFGMVYKYLRPSKLVRFSQEKMFRKLSRPADTDPNSLKINTEDIVVQAKKRKLYSGWGRISTEPEKRLEQLLYFLKVEKVPIIACQIFTNERPLFGHFRVLLDADASLVTFHDPHPKNGGSKLKWSMEKFVDYWRYTGQDVTGGVAIWIADRELLSPLDPDLPNRWYSTAIA